VGISLVTSAKGNTALAILLTTLTNAVGVALIPLWLKAVIGTQTRRVRGVRRGRVAAAGASVGLFAHDLALGAARRTRGRGMRINGCLPRTLCAAPGVPRSSATGPPPSRH
jgi:hypothetical protein